MRMVFDTSALFKRFVDEPGRERVLAVMASAETLMAAPHCKLELHSALVRLGREGRLDEALLRTTREAIELCFEEVDILPFTPSLERAAIRALEAGPLHAMDALHVATALVGRADLFVTADRRQAEAAVTSGLKTQLIEA